MFHSQRDSAFNTQSSWSRSSFTEVRGDELIQIGGPTIGQKDIRLRKYFSSCAASDANWAKSQFFWAIAQFRSESISLDVRVRRSESGLVALERK